jgi:hypothetical protein
MPKSRNGSIPRMSTKMLSPTKMKVIKELCSPAYIYLIISIIAILVAMFQNAGRTRSYTFCGYTMNVENTGIVFLIKGIIVVFWTIVLDSLCKNGFSQLSWLLLALPFIGFLCALVTMSTREGFKGKPKRKVKEGNTMMPPSSVVEDEDDPLAAAIKP